MTEYNPRRAFGRCEQPAMKVFVRADKEGKWVKYPKYLKCSNIHPARPRLPTLFEPGPRSGEEGVASTALEGNGVYFIYLNIVLYFFKTRGF